MKIVGGTFGVEGDAFINSAGELVVRGAKERRFPGTEIASVDTRVDKEKKFGCFGFVIGSILLAIPLGIFLNIFGLILAIVIAGAGSFYANKTNIADVKFASGDSVSLECTPRQVKKLVNLKA